MNYLVTGSDQLSVHLNSLFWKSNLVHVLEQCINQVQIEFSMSAGVLPLFIIKEVMEKRQINRLRHWACQKSTFTGKTKRG